MPSLPPKKIIEYKKLFCQVMHQGCLSYHINRIFKPFLLFVARIFSGSEAVLPVCVVLWVSLVFPPWLMLNVPPVPLGLVRPAAVLRPAVVEEVLLSSGLRI